MMFYGNGMSGWGMLLMTVSNLLFWALVIAGVVALVRYVRPDRPDDRSAPPASTPDQVLAERYARGEIDDEEYTRRLQVLAARRTGT
jgi:putative membrane protein